MRIDVNLGLRHSAHERYAPYWAGPLALGALVGLAYVTSSAVRNIRDYRRVHRSVTECQSQQRFLHDRQQAALRKLQQPRFQGILREANYVNSLIDRRQLSLTGLTAKLTRLLPVDVRLTTLSLAESTDGPLVRMTIESSNQEKVIAFVQNLENSPDFSDPNINSEDPGQQGPGQQGGGNTSGGMARVICTAHYRGWRNPEEAVAKRKEGRSQKAEARSER